jgi:cardiolipin synthase
MTDLEVWLLGLLVTVGHLALSIGVSVHIVLTKPDVRAAIGWVGLAWLAPVVGSLLYFFFGVNRLRRQAGMMRRGREAPVEPEAPPQWELALPERIAPDVRPLAHLVGAVTRMPLTAGNSVDVLVNGDEAYPAMLEAIKGARKSVALMTYIFNRGQVADRFADALERAIARGVQVRVLVDGVGARYSRPPIVRQLHRQGIPVARFLPTTPWRHPYLNLRNHRKLLVVDGTTGFCGGLNIQDPCMLSLKPRHPIQDTHFRFRGPVVGQMMRALAFDWKFTTREELTGPDWFAEPVDAGDVLARGIPSGPDEDYEALPLAMMGALAHARSVVRIATPYFLPNATVIDALRVAALSGVRVEILLPSQSNLRFVQWATFGQLSQVLRWGCRVYLAPPPFDHSKIFVVDDDWCMLGSANWDPRSTRLNFEYVVECHSKALATRLASAFDAKLAGAQRYTVADHDRRSLPVRLRDGVFRLAQPYL